MGLNRSSHIAKTVLGQLGSRLQGDPAGHLRSGCRRAGRDAGRDDAEAWHLEEAKREAEQIICTNIDIGLGVTMH
jgi:hypothetical protein